MPIARGEVRLERQPHTPRRVCVRVCLFVGRHFYDVSPLRAGLLVPIARGEVRLERPAEYPANPPL